MPVLVETSGGRELVRLGTSSDLPDQPDRGWVDGWLHRSHLRYWAELDQERRFLV